MLAAPCHLRPRCLPRIGHPARAGERGAAQAPPPPTEEPLAKPSLHPPRCDPSREPGSAPVQPGRRDAAGSCLPRPARIPISFLGSLWLWHQPRNLLFLMQTPPLPQRYQGLASPLAARHKQPRVPRVPRGPHPPQADITLCGELTRQEPPGPTEDSSGFPGPRHHDQGCNAASCHAGPASQEWQVHGWGGVSPGVPSLWSGSSVAGRAMRLQPRCPHRRDRPYSSRGETRRCLA